MTTSLEPKRLARYAIGALGLRRAYREHAMPLWARYVEWRAPCVFVHIPKTAGTSISRAIGMPGITHSDARAWRDHLGATRFTARHRFSVVRHPIDRLVSGRLWGYALADDGERRFGRDYAVPAELDDAEHLSRAVNQQLRQLLDDEAWVADRTMRNRLTIDGALAVDYVGKFEDMDAVVRHLQTQNLLRGELPRLKKISDNTKEKIRIEKDVFELFCTVFEQDFVTFGYEPRDTGFEID